MRHMAGRLLAVVPFILISLSPELAQAQKRVALLIGNKDYAAGVGALKNPHNDVAQVGTALAKVGFEVLPLLKNATREQILLAVHDYAESSRVQATMQLASSTTLATALLRAGKTTSSR